ncbi:protein YLS3-like [Carica papaya]|uniref:protein YLS3-like n=1 Tax=Carica papaya TaxID=3649 RepID=UPI000B8D1883|nr:protein YLS3-like [Carica papaya]
MGKTMRSKKVVVVVGVVLMVVGWFAASTMANIADDEKDCADQLTNLASCIPFVSGTAKKPTAECCQDTQKVKASKPKCLCVLIKESTDPSLGLPVNTTLALQMPSTCNIDAKVSDCPSILNLPADSPDASIFKEAGGASPTTNSSSSSSSTHSPSSSSTDSPSSSSTDSPSSSSSSESNSKPTTSNGEKLKLNINVATFFWVITAASLPSFLMNVN